MTTPPKAAPFASPLPLLCCVLCALLLSACSGGKIKSTAEPLVDPRPVPVTAPTRSVQVEIDLDTLDVRPVAPEGVRSCHLCTQALEAQYGPACANAPKAGRNLCEGLIDATVDEVKQIALLASHKNPRCITVASTSVGGSVRATQVCYCKPADPPGTCPAAVWVQ